MSRPTHFLYRERTIFEKIVNGENTTDEEFNDHAMRVGESLVYREYHNNHSTDRESKPFVINTIEPVKNKPGFIQISFSDAKTN